MYLFLEIYNFYDIKSLVSIQISLQFLHVDKVVYMCIYVCSGMCECAVTFIHMYLGIQVFFDHYSFIYWGKLYQLNLELTNMAKLARQFASYLPLSVFLAIELQFVPHHVSRHFYGYRVSVCMFLCLLDNNSTHLVTSPAREVQWNSVQI